MIKRFKFFRGCDPTLWIPDADDIEYYVRNPEQEVRPLRAIWTPQQHEDLHAGHGLDIESELTRLMSENIAREIDNNIIEALTRRINGGGNNHDGDYLGYWLRMGNNRA
jgi:hypothetical protein